MAASKRVTLKEIQAAAEMLKGKTIKTPLIHSPIISRMVGAEVYLKLENLQRTGSFKIRGATYKLHKHRATIGEKGVVAASAGNHAQGVALAATLAGVPATIVMPEWASISKQEATAGYGGKVHIEGSSVGESLRAARRMAQEGLFFIHPYDDPDIIAGQGTIALEILEVLPEADLIIAPVGGGGLISGVATVAKTLNPKIKLVGVQAANCPSAVESVNEGKPITVQPIPSIADGIVVKQPGELTFRHISAHVDDIVTAGEGDIARALLLLLERKKILAEGAGAIPLAALLNGSIAVSKNSRVVLVISGGNVDSPLLGRIISQGLVTSGRIMRVKVQLDDRPGALARLAAFVADRNANILHIFHERTVRDLPLYTTRVDLEMETRGPDHMAAIIQSLQAAKYQFEIK